MKHGLGDLRMKFSCKYWHSLYHRIFKRHTQSIRSRFTILFLLTFPTSIILVGIYFYSVVSSIITDNVNKELLQIIQQVNSKIESRLIMINQESMFLFSNLTIKNNLEISNETEDAYLTVKMRREIESVLSNSIFENYTLDSQIFKSIYIFKDKKTFYYYERYPEPEILENNLRVFTDFHDQKEEVKIFTPTLADQTFYLARRIVDLNRNRVNGTLILAVNESILEKLYTDDLNSINAQIYIYDKEGILLSCNKKEMLGKMANKEFLNLTGTENIQKQIINGEKYYIAINQFKNFDLMSATLIPEKVILRKLSSSIRIYLYIILAAAVLSIILGFLISYIFVKPIKDLISNLNKLKRGDFTVKMPDYKYYELNELSTVFNKMTVEIQSLFNQLFENQLLLKEAELKALQSQVNPHFLFNVLNTISWEAMQSKNEKINKMIVSLSHLLRANISMHTAEKIVISEEMKYIEFYLYLQEMRFGEKLTTNISIKDDSIRELYIPKFCIQTIVENAVVHGLEKKIGKRNLQINGFRLSESVLFEVIDDGVGFEADHVSITDSKTINYNKSNHESFGLYNVNKRIKLFYGEEYGLTIQSKLNEGTKVTIKIPADRGEKEYV